MIKSSHEQDNRELEGRISVGRGHHGQHGEVEPRHLCYTTAYKIRGKQ